MRMNRRRSLWALALPLGVGALSACSTLVPGPRSVDISEQRLLAVVSKQFPVERSYLDLVKVSLSDPSMRLMPEANRIGTRLNVSATTLLNKSRPWDGQIELSYGLRYEAKDQTVRLSRVVVEGFRLDGVPPAYFQPLRGLGTQMSETLMEDMVVHTLKPEDLRRVQGMGYQPGSLTVVPGGLKLQLDPIKNP